ILFEGGQTFGGTLSLGSDDNGVYVGSYGTGRATLTGGPGSLLTQDNYHPVGGIDPGQIGDAIDMRGVNGVTIQGINCAGFGHSAGLPNQGGTYGIWMVDSNNVTVDQVDVSEFQIAGIDAPHCSNVRITYVNASISALVEFLRPQSKS